MKLHKDQRGKNPQQQKIEKIRNQVTGEEDGEEKSGLNKEGGNTWRLPMV